MNQTAERRSRTAPPSIGPARAPAPPTLHVQPVESPSETPQSSSEAAPRVGPIRRLVRSAFDFTQRRPAASLWTYWAVAFVATHIPSPWPPTDRPPPDRLPLDKLGHFVGFAILTWLLVNALSHRRLVRPAIVLLAVLIVAAYGVVDELTQPPFNRTADVGDYAANLLGCAAGLLVAWRTLWRRRALAPSRPRRA